MHVFVFVHCIDCPRDDPFCTLHSHRVSFRAHSLPPLTLSFLERDSTISYIILSISVSMIRYAECNVSCVDAMFVQLIGNIFGEMWMVDMHWNCRDGLVEFIWMMVILVFPEKNVEGLEWISLKSIARNTVRFFWLWRKTNLSQLFKYIIPNINNYLERCCLCY